MAYKVKSFQVIGPDWLESERFDIDAKLPVGSTRDQVPEMLQSLLSDRFQMKFHNESKDLPVLALEVVPGEVKLKDLSDPDDAVGGKDAVEVTAQGSSAGVGVNLGKGSTYTFANNKFEGKKLTMAYIADTLSRFLDRPVVDMTGLTGKYDLSIALTEEDYRGMLIRSALSAGVSLPPEAVRYLDSVNDASLYSGLRAAGLKLESRKAPLPVIIVDHLQKTPTEN